MPFYTYKKHLKNGELVQPDFTTDTQRGFFYDASDKTYVCFIPDESEREYYVPDSLEQINRVELINRVKRISAITPFSKIHGQEGHMTVDEAAEWIDSFYTDFMGNSD